MAETKKSKIDLRQAIAEDLTLVPVGDAIPGEISQKIDDKIQNNLEYLDTENLLIFNAQADLNTAVIPGKVFEPLLDWCKETVGPAFGLPADKDKQLQAYILLSRAIKRQDNDRSTAVFF